MAARRAPCFGAASAAGLLFLALFLAGAGCGRKTEPTQGRTAPDPPVVQAPVSLDSTASRASNTVPATNHIAAEKPKLDPIELDGPLPEVAPEVRSLVQSLADFERSNEEGPAPEVVSGWKERLKELQALGVPAVSAIREFLARNEDQAFSGEVAEALSYESVRKALLGCLHQIGTVEATYVLGETLLTAAEPKEVALLARYLEDLAPGRYGDHLMTAAREALAMGAANQLEGYDVAPLFEVLQKFGGANAVPDLEWAAVHWQNYAALSLAELPDGAGVRALARITEDTLGGRPNAARGAALEMLAQLAPSNSDARRALLEQVKANRVPDATWRQLASVLSGDQVHIQDAVLKTDQPPQEARTRSAESPYGNQYFFYAPPKDGLSEEQLRQQFQLLEELRATTKDPDAQRILDLCRKRLESRINPKPEIIVHPAPESGDGE